VREKKKTQYTVTMTSLVTINGVTK